MSLRCAAAGPFFQSAIGHGLRRAWLFAFLSCLPFALAAAPGPPPTSAVPTLLVMGDSLSAAYGLNSAQGWVALTAARMCINQRSRSSVPIANGACRIRRAG